MVDCCVRIIEKELSQGRSETVEKIVCITTLEKFVPLQAERSTWRTSIATIESVYIVSRLTEKTKEKRFCY